MTKMSIGATFVAICAGCASVAATTRPGSLQEVRLADSLTPLNVRVQPGDELRWINERSTPVTIEFLEGALEDVSCERGFSARSLRNLRGQLREVATIEPSESASLCFTNVETVRYNARMESAVAGGQLIESGTIRVGR
jgi:hypothetical protein